MVSDSKCQRFRNVNSLTPKTSPQGNYSSSYFPGKAETGYLACLGSNMEHFSGTGFLPRADCLRNLSSPSSASLCSYPQSSLLSGYLAPKHLPPLCKESAMEIGETLDLIGSAHGDSLRVQWAFCDHSKNRDQLAWSFSSRL